MVTNECKVRILGVIGSTRPAFCVRFSYELQKHFSSSPLAASMPAFRKNEARFELRVQDVDPVGLGLGLFTTWKLEITGLRMLPSGHVSTRWNVSVHAS